jgi:hypothetical protein
MYRGALDQSRSGPVIDRENGNPSDVGQENRIKAYELHRYINLVRPRSSKDFYQLTGLSPPSIVELDSGYCFTNKASTTITASPAAAGASSNKTNTRTDGSEQQQNKSPGPAPSDEPSYT